MTKKKDSAPAWFLTQKKIVFLEEMMFKQQRAIQLLIDQQETSAELINSLVAKVARAEDFANYSEATTAAIESFKKTAAELCAAASSIVADSRAEHIATAVAQEPLGAAAEKEH